MCGIAGFITNNNFSSDKNIHAIKKMIFKLKDRGPDSDGFWISKDNKVVLGHSRLSILDLSITGSQPMISDSGRYVISFNGEIYNHLQIRKKFKLEQFRGSSDTETLLKCFDIFGLDRTLEIIDGMFSISVWDNKTEELFLIRDRFGEKPLYFGMDLSKKYFFFASQVKSIQEFDFFTKKIDKKSLNHYFNYNYIGNDKSIYEGLTQVSPATYVKVSLSSMTFVTVKYWNRNFSSGLDYSEKDIVNYTEELLSNSIKNRLLSDVPVGCFLSGGIDSSLVVSIIKKKLNLNVDTFSIGFFNNDYNEAHHAKKIAHFLKTNHHEYYITGRDIEESLYSMGTIYDEPFADSSQVPTYLLSKFAKKKVTVCLTGDGADELFYGYDRYRYAKTIFNYLSPIPYGFRKFILNNKSHFFYLKNFLNKLSSFCKTKRIGNKIDRVLNLVDFRDFNDLYLKIIKNESYANQVINPHVLLDRESEESYFDFNSNNIYDEFSKIANFDQSEYLPYDILTKVDRASMSNSLETRTPFLNKDLVEYSLSISSKVHLNNNNNKSILKKILSKYLPKNLYDRPKMGFGVPVKNWIHHEYASWSNELLSKESLDKSGLINTNFVRKIFQENKNNKNESQNLLWSVLMFQSWYNKNF